MTRVLGSLFAALVVWWTGFAWAGEGTVRVAALGTKYVVASDCASVISSFNWHYQAGGSDVRLVGCSSDPVIVGTEITYFQGASVAYKSNVTAVTATPSAGPQWFVDWLNTPTAPAWFSSSPGGGDVAQVICVPAAVTVAPCQTGFAPWAPVVSDAEPFDYAYAGAIFAFFFCSTVALWWVSKSAGVILDAIRKF